MRARTLAAAGALLMAFGVSAEAARLSDDEVARLLSRVEEDVESFVEAADTGEPGLVVAGPSGEMTFPEYLEALRSAASTMAERFDEDDPAGAEVVAFLRHVRTVEARAAAGLDLFGAGEEWLPLEESASRLAEAYGVDRSLDPPLWRSLRMNDAEVVSLLGSLESVAPPFARELTEVSKLLDPCTIMGTEREDVLEAARRLEHEAEALREAVEDGRDTSGELAAVLSTGAELREFLERHSITRVLRPTWGPLERDLSLVERAFGVDPS